MRRADLAVYRNSRFADRSFEECGRFRVRLVFAECVVFGGFCRFKISNRVCWAWRWGWGVGCLGVVLVGMKSQIIVLDMYL